MTDSSNKRPLSCRKCLAHGKQASLKGHSIVCPYLNCTCKYCSRLQRRRKTAFVRRHRDVLSQLDDDLTIETIQDLGPSSRPKWTIAKSSDRASNDTESGSQSEEDVQQNEPNGSGSLIGLKEFP